LTISTDNAVIAMKSRIVGNPSFGGYFPLARDTSKVELVPQYEAPWLDLFFICTPN